MPTAQLTLVDRSVRTAARRLVGQSLLNNLAGWLALSTGLALAWFLIQPLLFDSPPAWIRWAVLAGVSVLGLGMAVWQTVKAAPTRRSAALEVDSRFNLRERVTTALELTPDVQRTPAGEAVTADAEAKVKKLSVGEKFPVKPRWTVFLAPLFAALIAVVVLWWNPPPINFNGLDPNANKGKGTEQANATPLSPEAKKKKEEEQKKLDELANRKDRDPKLAELEKEMADLNNKHKDDKNAYENSPEKKMEKTAEVTKLEEKAEKYVKDQERKLKELADKLGQLEKLNDDDAFKDKADPGAKLNDDLSKGDLKKAEAELEGLEDKLKKDELTPPEAEKLEKQLDKIEDELERLQREQDEKDEKKKDELEKEKQKAEDENRKEDAEELDRELERMKEDQQAGADSKELGEQLQKASDGLKKGTEEGKQEAAQALKKAKAAVKKMQARDKDSQEGQARLQQLKKDRAEAAAQAQAAGEKGEKGTKPGQGDSPMNNGGIGEGQRPENKDAKTQAEEQRIRSLMDLKGETKFGGTTEGKGFKKTVDKDLGGAIKKAAQDAPGEADVQRLPRDAKDSVAEYFKKLGGTDNK